VKVALVSPPFIPVPPKQYGGTELFIAHLGEGLRRLGDEVVVYANGESTIENVRSMYAKSEWPVEDQSAALLKELNHASWALADAHGSDIVHLNSAPAVALTRVIKQPAVYTIHHPYEKPLNEYYRHFSAVDYVAISEFQRKKAALPKSRTIHHGLDLAKYRLSQNKQDYLAFLGRIAPVKGVHLAIEVARKAGLPLKIAGEIQPIYNEYWETQIKPHVDGKSIEYVGQVGLEGKNELLGGARAMLFPIQWNEPFGLVMVEAMACGTPVIALRGGSVQEVVRDGVSGQVCRSVEEMAQAAQELKLVPEKVRRYAEEHFSVQKMVAQYRELYGEILQQRANKVAGGPAAA
jgi:glycosyltransferase involved in cell wall biosynthesis